MTLFEASKTGPRVHDKFSSRNAAKAAHARARARARPTDRPPGPAREAPPRCFLTGSPGEGALADTDRAPSSDPQAELRPSSPEPSGSVARGAGPG